MPIAELLALVFAIMGLVVVLVFLFVILGLFRLWLQGILVGVSVPVFELIAMKLRRIDAALVMKCLILASQRGVALPAAKLQRAYLPGMDLEKLTLAHIAAHKQQLGASFDQIVESELQDRLEEKFKR